MSGDGGFDPEALPLAAGGDGDQPSALELGAFSLSLPVADLGRSRSFYEALGFAVTGGDADQGWLILRNGETTIGLFHGMFDRPMLTFNPGLTPRMERLERFTDVREIEAALDAAGIPLQTPVEPGTSGAGSLTIVDPDGNPILVDQFF